VEGFVAEDMLEQGRTREEPELVPVYWMAARRVHQKRCCGAAARSDGCELVQPEEEKAARGPYKCLQISAGWVSGGWGQALFSGAQ